MAGHHVDLHRLWILVGAFDSPGDFPSRQIILQATGEPMTPDGRTPCSWLTRHQPIGFQQQKLCQKLRGHYAYYGVTGNVDSLQRFHQEVRARWRKWLNRRNRERTMTWDVFGRLFQRYPLAPVRIVHSVYNT